MFPLLQAVDNTFETFTTLHISIDSYMTNIYDYINSCTLCMKRDQMFSTSTKNDFA